MSTTVVAGDIMVGPPTLVSFAIMVGSITKVSLPILKTVRPPS